MALARLFKRLAATRCVISVLHDLPLALHADRLLVLRDGRVHADGGHDDPALHAALVAAFDGAIRIQPGPGRGRGRAIALPALDP